MELMKIYGNTLMTNLSKFRRHVHKVYSNCAENDPPSMKSAVTHTFCTIITLNRSRVH